MNLKVSIITPSFNRANIIHETAESIFRQTYSNWEWVIVDDGSTDESWEVINKYSAQDSRVKVFKRDREPKGACTCRNIAVSKCSGEFLIFLDTDDLIESFCIKNRVSTMLDNPELDFAIFPSLMFEFKPYDLELWWNIDKPQSELLRQLYQDAICQGTGIIITKKAFLKVGSWDEQLTIWQDIDLFLRLYIQNFKYKKFFSLPADLHNRINPSSISRYDCFRNDKIESRVKVIKNTAYLLETKHEEVSLTDLKFMLAEIIFACVMTKRKNVLSLMNWGQSCGIITRSELALFYFVKLAYKFKVYKVIGVRNLINQVHLVFTPPIQTTLATISTRKK